MVNVDILRMNIYWSNWSSGCVKFQFLWAAAWTVFQTIFLRQFNAAFYQAASQGSENVGKVGASLIYVGKVGASLIYLCCKKCMFLFTFWKYLWGDSCLASMIHGSTCIALSRNILYLPVYSYSRNHGQGKTAGVLKDLDASIGGWLGMENLGTASWMISTMEQRVFCPCLLGLCCDVLISWWSTFCWQTKMPLVVF